MSATTTSLASCGRRWTSSAKFPDRLCLGRRLIPLYIALLGPADYFFLRQFAGRMPWTWVTFPLLVIVFTGLAVISPGNSNCPLTVNHGRSRRHRHGRPSSRRGPLGSRLQPGKRARTAWKFRVHTRLQPALSRSGKIVAWQGLPGTGLGENERVHECGVRRYVLHHRLSGRRLHANAGDSDSGRLDEEPLESVVGDVSLSGEARLSRDSDGLLDGRS